MNLQEWILCSLPLSSFIRWSFTYFCREEFMELLNMESVPLNYLVGYCVPCWYVTPSSIYENNTSELLAPMRCVVHISTCLSYKQYLVNHDESLLLSEERHQNTFYHCYNDPYNVMGALMMRRGQFAWNVYRKLHHLQYKCFLYTHTLPRRLYPASL